MYPQWIIYEKKIQIDEIKMILIYLNQQINE